MAPEGLLLIDKPPGMTSHDVVDRVRRALGTRKVGHAGTLDPMATGLLLVGVGRATRLLRYLGDLPKAYEGTGVLGVRTDTLDAEGEVVATAPVEVDRTALDRAVAELVGESLQRPPAYSAVKVGGRKLYEAARRGEALEAAPRPIRVDAFEVRAFDRPSFDFALACSGGTYVRMLVADVGDALGCGAHLTRLRRTAIGPFAVADAAPVDALGEPFPLERAVAHLPRVDLEEAEEARAAANGGILAPAGIDGPYGVYAPDGRLIGIWRDQGAKARPEMVLGPGSGPAREGRAASCEDWPRSDDEGAVVKTEHAREAPGGKKHRRHSDVEDHRTRLPKKVYEKELRRLQEELVKMEQWVADTGARLVVVFEGRDAAGKGGTIKRITQYMNPRITRIAALPVPTERERTQWYFQRYIEHLPAAGQIVLFDRSWYNRAGVEKVLGFCTPEEHRRFLRQCPIFERLLIEDGIILIKYWFSVSDEEQERRFQSRINDPMRRWKLSPTDLHSRTNWVDYSRAKDEMFVHTDIPEAPWHTVEADDKPSARLNCIAHLLSKIPYEARPVSEIEIPARQSDEGYVRPAREAFTYVPDHAASLLE